MDPVPSVGWRAWRDRLLLQEDLNFLLTNRVPRIALTRALGWLSAIRNPLVREVSLAVWKMAGDLDLSDARKSRFDSLHDCFIRELRPGARPLDPDQQALLSPSDGILGAHGVIAAGQMLQAKGMAYTLGDLLGSEEAAREAEGCAYATLRLTSGMYHRFHSPHDGTLLELHHLDGDTWNVNPIALKRVERLFCRNERAAIRLQLAPGDAVMTLVPVAAVGVSGLRVHGVDVTMRAGEQGPQRHAMNRAVRRGDELGWFQHGSTIIVLAPPGYRLCEGLMAGHRLRMGQRLMRRDAPRADAASHAAPGSEFPGAPGPAPG